MQLSQGLAIADGVLHMQAVFYKAVQYMIILGLTPAQKPIPTSTHCGLSISRSCEIMSSCRCCTHSALEPSQLNFVKEY